MSCQFVTIMKSISFNDGSTEFKDQEIREEGKLFKPEAFEKFKIPIKTIQKAQIIKHL